MRKFKLKSDQIEFLKKMYPDNELVQRVLKSEKNGNFEIDVDTEIDFMSILKTNPYIGWTQTMKHLRRHTCWNQ